MYASGAWLIAKQGSSCLVHPYASRLFHCSPGFVFLRGVSVPAGMLSVLHLACQHDLPVVGYIFSFCIFCMGLALALCSIHFCIFSFFSSFVGKAFLLKGVMLGLHYEICNYLSFIFYFIFYISFLYLLLAMHDSYSTWVCIALCICSATRSSMRVHLQSMHRWSCICNGYAFVLCIDKGINNLTDITFIWT